MHMPKRPWWVRRALGRGCMRSVRLGAEPLQRRSCAIRALNRAARMFSESRRRKRNNRVEPSITDDVMGERESGNLEGVRHRCLAQIINKKMVLIWQCSEPAQTTAQTNVKQVWPQVPQMYQRCTASFGELGVAIFCTDSVLPSGVVSNELFRRCILRCSSACKVLSFHPCALCETKRHANIATQTFAKTHAKFALRITFMS